MKTRLFLLCAVLNLFAFCGDCQGAEPPEIEHAVTTVLKIGDPNKIGVVFWTIQRSICTIQISSPGLPDGQKQPDHAPTQIWLLRADGTIISQSEKPSRVGLSNGGYTNDRISYVFPATAKTEARAVVISVGDDFFVEPLLPSTK